MKPTSIQNKGYEGNCRFYGYGGWSVAFRMTCRTPLFAERCMERLRILIVCAVVCTGLSLSAQNTYFRTEAGVPYIPVLATAPTPTSVGAFYTNSTDKLTYWYDGSQWVPVDLGVVADVFLTSNPVLYKGQTVSPEVRYIYSGDKTAAACTISSSTYKWYRADDAAGTNKTVLSSGTGTPPSYTVVSADVGKYIGLGVTPITSCNSASFESVSWKPVSALTPAIAKVDLSGLTGSYALKSNQLMASFSGYTCSPVLIPGDAGTASTYRWYYANDALGTGKTAISGKTAAFYNVSFSDGYTAGKYIAVGVTPVASNGDAGVEKMSSWYATAALVPAYDVANIVGLTRGKAKNATIIAALKGIYSVAPSINGTEGAPLYQWYYATSSTGTGKTAISGQTGSTHSVNIGGSYGYVNDTYCLAVGITPVTTTGETGSEVLSGWVQIQVDKSADGTAVNEITSSTGRVWMDRNLGATQAATSSTDYLAYGSLYQWCRVADGHEKITWTSATAGTPLYSTTTTLSTSTTPGHSFFITNTTTPYDWLASQQSDGSLWWNGTTVGANNPCPTGFHVPTYAEWSAELPNITNATTAYNALKLTLPGWRSYINSSLNSVGSYSYYWCSSSVAALASVFYLGASFANIYNDFRGFGFSVRCIKDLDAPQVQSVSVSGTPMPGSALTATYTYVPPQTTGSSEGTSTYKWYVASDGIGTGKTALSGATAENYTVASPVVVGQYIAFGVTPVSIDGKTGAEMLSSWVQVRSSITVAAPDGTLVVDMTSPSGRIWMDRNLGASRAATSSTDYLAYGSLYQWCRAADGHERITWTNTTTGAAVYGTSTTLSSTTTPTHSLFITNNNSPYDWLSTQQADGSIWWNRNVAGANSPCPVGYHVPTSAEWNTELALFASNGGKNATGAYSVLKLPFAGYRYYTNGSMFNAGSEADYWSSTETGAYAISLHFVSSDANMATDLRGNGFSVRCIKDLTTTAVVDIVSPTTGRVWMDRNIGATQAATSSTDYLAYGSLFQWCRAADGHEKINWTSATSGTAVNGTTSTLSTTSTLGHSLFIIPSATPFDWFSTQLSDGTLWWDGVATAGANTPCPAGYHVPTYEEWKLELSGITDAATAYSILKLPQAGYRKYNDGIMYVIGSNGYYYSSTLYGIASYALGIIGSGSIDLGNGHPRAQGFSVRCIKNLEYPQAQRVTVSGTVAVGNTVTGTYTYVPPQTTGKVEGTSVYRWYVATNASGTGKTTITGATAKTYTIASPVGAGKYIAFGVTPVSTDGKTGTEVLSSWVVVTTQITAYDGTVVNELVSPSGRIWMDRNLGANRVATSSTDYLAYGSLFQWCRPADSHEKINWTSATTGTPANGTTAGPIASTTPGNSLFITNSGGTYDWLSTQQPNGNLWWNGTTVGTNNPCPTGYHVPTYAEWNTEQALFANNGGNNAIGAYNMLKLSLAGYRVYSDGSLANIGVYGLYWSCTVAGRDANNLAILNNDAAMNYHTRANGFSVRCIKDLTAPDGTLVVDMVSPSGRTWMDRNLGATRQATSSTDYLAYGSLYQWSRAADGHQKITWTGSTAGTPVNGTTTTLSTTTTPGHSSFITPSATVPYDWLSPQQSDGSLWWSGATAGANTPCPAGYHVPTYLEWASEQALFAGNGGANATGAYNTLRLTIAGNRHYTDGTLMLAGNTGYYWSSVAYSKFAYCIYFNSGSSTIGAYYTRADGYNVRCIKDIPLPITTTVVDMVSPSGRTWMDRNIGASRAASSSTDYQAYGSLFQWARGADGHEKIIWTSSTTGTPVYNTYSTLSTSTVPGHSLFIINNTSPYDWLSTQQTDGKLWWNGIVAGANSPCPTGYHVPTYAEWNAELAYITNTTTAYSVLKIPIAGIRKYDVGTLDLTGTSINLWASTVGAYAYTLFVSSSGTSMNDRSRAFGINVRCIKNQTDIPKAQGVSVTGSVMMGATLTGSYTYVPPQISATAEGTSTYKWYVATDGSGMGSTAISGATAKTYTVASPVALGKYIAFGVTPVSSDGKIGSEVISSWVMVTPDGTRVVDMISPTTGKVWMDRNLGATQTATSKTDASSYGSLYQWCRGVDGHQLRTSTTQNTQMVATTTGNPNFIIGYADWSDSGLTNGDLWWNGTTVGTNNPCPTGYHVPTNTEWNNELSGITSPSDDWLFTRLKLSLAGERVYNNGVISNAGSFGYYWSCILSGTTAYGLNFSGSGGAGLLGCHRAHGFSVRCIKN